LEASVCFPADFRTLANSQSQLTQGQLSYDRHSANYTNRTLRRLPNATYRPREYLTEKEVDRLIEAARKRGRNGARDAAAILLAYRHGLRAAELCSLRWSQIDLRNGRLHVNRAKGGIESVHPLHGPELRALRPLQGSSPYVFVTEAGTPVTPAWFLRMVQRTGRAAKLLFPIHPHMLRHSTGYKLANQGEDTRSLAHYLGHRNLQSTARYTALAPDRFAKFWKDLRLREPLEADRRDNSRGPRLPQRFSPDPRWDVRIYPESLVVDCVLMATGSNYLLRLPACLNSALR
jgi:type 1 fimbriae regulatory protein FimE